MYLVKHEKETFKKKQDWQIRDIKVIGEGKTYSIAFINLLISSSLCN